MSDEPPKPKRIKLGLFLPWDKDGRLFNEERFAPPDPDPDAKTGTIVPFPKPPDNTPDDA